MNPYDDFCERFVHSGIVMPDAANVTLAQWRERLDWSSDAQALADELVVEGVLSRFQAEALLAGLTQPWGVGPWQLLDLIAAGRLGNIFRAVHTETREPASVKVFPRTLAFDDEKLARMHREAHVSVQLSHPAVVRCIELGQAEGVTYVAFEPLECETLAARLERDGRLPFGEACRLIYQAALGIEYLHSEGVVHRDVQPANLLLTTDRRLKVLEFGAARDALEMLDSDNEQSLTQLAQGSILGTFDYMSPEQALDTHGVDSRCDVYSLGCVLYHCLTGQPPVPDAHPVRQMLRHQSEQPQPIEELASDVPFQLAECVRSMLSKRPEDRLQRARDAASLLKDFFVEEHSSTVVSTERSIQPTTDDELQVETVDGAQVVRFYSPDALKRTPIDSVLNELTSIYRPFDREETRARHGTGGVPRQPGAEHAAGSEQVRAGGWRSDVAVQPSTGHRRSILRLSTRSHH